MDRELLDLRVAEGVATLKIDRPEKLNALNRRVLEALQEAFASLADDESVRAIVLTGAGDKAFVAGADIAEIREQSPVQARAFSALGQALMSRIQHMEKPVIAAVNGFALGGGLELAMACHLRLASDRARLGLPEIKLGIMPGFGGTQRLARLVGPARALDLALSGEPVDAETAERIGLVHRVVPHDELADAADERAAALAAAAPEAVRGILQAVQASDDVPLAQGLALETARFAVCCATEDMKEGTSAFLEKRRPAFSGR